jgi:1-deoxy-D-xylulose-5-phosphate synthase
LEGLPLLTSITNPELLRSLSPGELSLLAAEIRQVLTNTVSRNGGHLASNLGVVELTIALHLCFQSPQDALVWDVSHQSYTHKLLTGRYGCFATLRQSGGISGFTDPAESVHDFFRTGHAGTSVSAALGIAEAKRIRGESGYSVAILGDGASTCGLVYEAMNNAGRSEAKMIVILNDNEMSISRNVGGVSRYLGHVRSQPLYRITKRRVERGLRHIPGVGGSMAKGVRRVKGFVKRILTNTTLFEDLGFAYIGPVDGHDFSQLHAAFESAKLTPRPALVHVCTTKGKGYGFAEQSPESFHGVPQFDLETGEPIACGRSFSAIFGEALCDLAARDTSICAITAAMGISTGLQAFEARYPERFFDVGIAESHAVTFAAGLARLGCRPVFAVYSTFLQRSYGQLLHDAALQGLPLVLMVDRAGFVGEDGATHHGLYDVAFCASIPGAVVYAPVTEQELRTCLGNALLPAAPAIPIFIRVPRGCPAEIPARYQPTNAPFDCCGEASAAVAVVTYGRLFAAACEAAEKLRAQELPVKILKLNCVLPLANEAARAVLTCAVIHFFEEGTRGGGAGERFGALLLDAGYRGRYVLHAVDGFPRHAPVAELLREYGLDAEAMQSAVMGEITRG